MAVVKRARQEAIDTLAAAINDAQIQPGEIALGHDLRPVAARILAALPHEEGWHPPDGHNAGRGEMTRRERRRRAS